MGPLLFLIYINDFHKCSRQLHFHLFADDANINILESNLNNELGKVHSWLSANKLSLNINKSNFVLFHPIQRKIPKSVTLFINNQSLTEEHSIRYLGIYIDSNLNWKSHINKNIDNISVHKVNCATFESFELSEYFVTAGSLRFRLAIIYRPPYSTNHPVTVNTFIGEFSTYLESIVMSSEPLCLTGDFNIHVDDINDSAARLFADLLDSMALNQHVHSATHELGHTLDLVITRQSDHLIFGEPCADFLFSDRRDSFISTFI